MTDELVKHATGPLSRDENVRGVLLMGSRARGDALPGSDLDLLTLVHSLTEPSFCSKIIEGTLVERHVREVARAKARLLENPTELYSYLDGQAIYDPDDLLAELMSVAKDRFKNYQTPNHEKLAILYWLRSTSLKLNASMAAGNVQKSGYYASINSWKVLEGLWAFNDKPVPPAGAVWSHLADLHETPVDLAGLLRALFEGDTPKRAQTMLELIDWLLERTERKR